MGLDIASAVAWAKERLDSTRAVEVTIIAPGEAGGESIDGLKAVPLTRAFEDFPTDEFAVKAQTFDWLVTANDLTFPIAGKLEPVEGWELRYVRDDGETEIYEVRPERGSKAFSFGDPLQKTLILHTKKSRVE